MTEEDNSLLVKVYFFRGKFVITPLTDEFTAGEMKLALCRQLKIKDSFKSYFIVALRRGFEDYLIEDDVPMKPLYLHLAHEMKTDPDLEEKDDKKKKKKKDKDRKKPLVVFRPSPFFVSVRESQIKDPDVLLALQQFYAEEIAVGRYIFDDDHLRVLAAANMRINFGSKMEKFEISKEFRDNTTKYCPPALIKNHFSPWSEAIRSNYTKFQKLGEDIVSAMYLSVCRRLPYYGSVFMPATVEKKEVFLGVNCKGVHVFHMTKANEWMHEQSFFLDTYDISVVDDGSFSNVICRIKNPEDAVTHAVHQYTVTADRGVRVRYIFEKQSHALQRLEEDIRKEVEEEELKKKQSKEKKKKKKHHEQAAANADGGVAKRSAKATVSVVEAPMQSAQVAEVSTVSSAAPTPAPQPAVAVASSAEPHQAVMHTVEVGSAPQYNQANVVQAVPLQASHSQSAESSYSGGGAQQMGSGGYGSSGTSPQANFSSTQPNMNTQQAYYQQAYSQQAAYYNYALAGQNSQMGNGAVYSYANAGGGAGANMGQMYYNPGMAGPATPQMNQYSSLGGSQSTDDNDKSYEALLESLDLK